jgi:hypothetical protein
MIFEGDVVYNFLIIVSYQWSNIFLRQKSVYFLQEIKSELSHTVLFNRWPEDGCLLVLVIWGIYFFHA